MNGLISVMAGTELDSREREVRGRTAKSEEDDLEGGGIQL
jgi:hypothetical protein